MFCSNDISETTGQIFMKLKAHVCGGERTINIGICLDTVETTKSKLLVDISLINGQNSAAVRIMHCLHGRSNINSELRVPHNVGIIRPSR